jgi:hypothetical protein
VSAEIDGRPEANHSADSGDDAGSGVCRAGENRRRSSERVTLVDFDFAVAGCVEQVGGEAADTVGVRDVLVDADRGGEHAGGARSCGRRQRIGEAAEIPESATLGCQSIEVGLHGQQRRVIPDGDEESWIAGRGDPYVGGDVRSFQAEGSDDPTAGGVGVVRQGDDALAEPDFDAVVTADGGRGEGAASGALAPVVLRGVVRVMACRSSLVSVASSITTAVGLPPSPSRVQAFTTATGGPAIRRP